MNNVETQIEGVSRHLPLASTHMHTHTHEGPHVQKHMFMYEKWKTEKIKFLHFFL